MPRTSVFSYGVTIVPVVTTVLLIVTSIPVVTIVPSCYHLKGGNERSHKAGHRVMDCNCSSG